MTSSGLDPQVMITQLIAEAERLEHAISISTEAREAEDHRNRQRAKGRHRLEAELLDIQSELHAACRAERSANDAAAAGALALPDAGPVKLERAVSRDAVKAQSNQIRWRCEELRQLEAKIEDADGQALARRQRLS